MVKKFEYADPVYYCRVKMELQKEGFERVNVGEGHSELIRNTECFKSPDPDCRNCVCQKLNDWVFDRRNI